MLTDFSMATILFIDDDRLARRMQPAVLAGVGAAIATASGAEEALVYLKDHRPDLILCDAVMPVTDGFAFCAQLKADPAFRDIPFAILTSLSRNVGERSLQAGADDFFLKSGSEVLLRLRTKLLLEISLRGADVVAPLETFAGSRVMMASLSAPLMIQLSLQLTPAGLMVESHPGTRGVLGRMEGPPPTLLILDARLEDGDAPGLAAAVRAHAPWAQVPILVLAEKGEEPALDAGETLVQDWLSKPLDSREVKRRVVMMLRYARAVRDFA